MLVLKKVFTGLDMKIALIILLLLSVMFGAYVYKVMKIATVAEFEKHTISKHKYIKDYKLKYDINRNQKRLEIYNKALEFKDAITRQFSEDTMYEFNVQDNAKWKNKRNNRCLSKETCYVWYTISVDQEYADKLYRLFDNLDVYIDRADGTLKGKIRLIRHKYNHSLQLFYRVEPV